MQGWPNDIAGIKPAEIAAARPAPPQPWELFEAKMAKAGLSEAAKGAFKLNYEQLVAGVTGLVGAARGAAEASWLA